MTSYEFQIKDFILHKKYVLESGSILIDYLLKNNEEDLAFNLLKNLSKHDDSKLNEDEFKKLCEIPYNTNSFTNSKEKMDEKLKKCIELHWKNNRHHPEYWDNVLNMSELDIMEMCCDWHARSKQYNTDFLEFVKTRQNTRFHFPKKIFDKIWNYCLILENKTL